MIIAADLRNQLRKIGYQADWIVRSGMEAVEWAIRTKPDLVLMDVRLDGDMDGMEAARWISTTVHIPVVYLTAHSYLFLAEPSQMQWPGLCLAKPVRIGDLRDVIEMVLSQRGGEVKSCAAAG